MSEYLFRSLLSAAHQLSSTITAEGRKRRVVSHGLALAGSGRLARALRGAARQVRRCSQQLAATWRAPPSASGCVNAAERPGENVEHPEPSTLRQLQAQGPCVRRQHQHKHAHRYGADRGTRAAVACMRLNWRGELLHCTARSLPVAAPCERLTREQVPSNTGLRYASLASLACSCSFGRSLLHNGAGAAGQRASFLSQLHDCMQQWLNARPAYARVPIHGSCHALCLRW